MLNCLTQTEKHLGSGAANVVKIMVGEYEIIVLRVGLVCLEIREDGADIARVRTAGNAVYGVVGAGVRNPRGSVVVEVAAFLVSAWLFDRRPVAYRVHGLDRPQDF